MELIDRVKFKERLEFLIYELYHTEPKPFGDPTDEQKVLLTSMINHIINMLEYTKIENAIPIKWFESKQTSGKLSFADCAAVEDLLNEWEKENETYRCR